MEGNRMPIEITMPKLSDTMEEGTILRWFKREGDRVERGEVLAEVETDKADMELEASNTGTVSEIRIKEGEAAAVGAVIAVLGEDGEGGRPRPQTPAEKPPAGPTAVVSAPGAESTNPPAGARAPARAPEAPPKAPRSDAGRTAAPPPGGPKATTATPRTPAAPAHAAPSPPRSAPAPTPAPTTRWEPREATPPPAGRQDISKLRLTVAKQMAASKRDIPHFYVTAEIDMTEAARLRESIATTAAIPERITFTHLMIRALALTLPRHPRVNASWADNGIAYHDDVNIGVAVAVEDGLVAPVLRACQQLSLRGIARATGDLVSKAQAGRFGGDELSGATFTLSNMGMLDIEEFSAVITPPQAAILAVGSIKERPVVRSGQLGVAKTMRVTLSVDHRVLNGVEAGRFLENFKTVLEHPLALLLGED
jgi:pyruvate dehydrogenase E2 component (dihydrolipoamide acetyltransferase)